MRENYYRYDGACIDFFNINKFCGQYLQDQYIYENFFKNRKGGVFIDIGAHDGVSLSNTLFFERFMNWTGLCIEPNPDVFNFLQKNRDNCLQAALSDKEETVEFTKIKGYAQTLSGITAQYHKNYPKRIQEEIQNYGGSEEKILLKTRTLNSILEELPLWNKKAIDFMSVDTEGSELTILNGLDFNRFCIKVIAVENNYDSQEHREFMKARGYTFKERLKIEDIYYKT